MDANLEVKASNRMAIFGQQIFLRHPRAIRKLGIFLFVLSFIVPAPQDWGGRLYFFPGAIQFILTPNEVWAFLTGGEPLSDETPDGDSMNFRGFLFCCILFGAWLANFSIFFRLPKLITLAVIALPWIVFIWTFSLTVDFIPFYFWALGIALIHLSKFLKPAPDVMPVPLLN